VVKPRRNKYEDSSAAEIKHFPPKADFGKFGHAACV